MLIKSYGYDVVMQKCDPYINVDPGLMSPYQHGEVFVTDDGAETDLDLGHYERFLDTNLTKLSSVTTGSIYSTVIQREREGGYNGMTVQVVPQIVDEIKARMRCFELMPTVLTDTPEPQRKHSPSIASGQKRFVIIEIGELLVIWSRQHFLKQCDNLLTTWENATPAVFMLVIFRYYQMARSSRPNPPSIQSELCYLLV